MTALRCVYVLLGFVICLSGSEYSVPRSRRPVEVVFARLDYTSHNNEETYIKNSRTDYPNMDSHLAELVNKISNIHIDRTLVRPESGRVFEYPLVYIVEPEQMNLTSKQAGNLHEYVARGGILFTDDFHGSDEFSRAVKEFRKILPDMRLFEIKTDHELFHCFFDIYRLEQVVNNSIADCAPDGCEQWENGPSGKEPRVFVDFDKAGHLRLLMAFNNDLGDGLEYADDASYPQKMAAFSARFVSNVLVYSLTH